MPLSEQEQRLLDEMERSLYRNDADFVATGGRRGRPNYRSMTIGILLAAGGVAALIAGVAIPQLLVGIAGFVLMFAGVLLALTPSKRLTPEDITSSTGSPRAAAHDSGGFIGRMNDRWERRQEGRE